MLRKSLTLCAAVFYAGAPLPGFAAENSAAPTFLGAQSCAAGSCHGGGGGNHDQNTIWLRRDFHHERPYALLENRRAEAISEFLHIAHPEQDARCTVCHAPMQTVAAVQLSPGINITDGVSCENCHGPAENWIRSHTRHDYTETDRTRSGMRDLRNLYVRANACVACHQNIDSGLRAAGHPELTFEMDGQCASEPRHWPKEFEKPALQIWLVGQAVALREMEHALGEYAGPFSKFTKEMAMDQQTLTDRAEGLLRLLETVAPAIGVNTTAFAEIHTRTPTPRSGEIDLHKWSDDLARAAANYSWTEATTRAGVQRLLTIRFDDNSSREIKARGAERLVLALDRIPVKTKDAAYEMALDALFADVQSLPDFEPAVFSRDWETMRAQLNHVFP